MRLLGLLLLGALLALILGCIWLIASSVLPVSHATYITAGLACVAVMGAAWVMA